MNLGETKMLEQVRYSVGEGSKQEEQSWYTEYEYTYTLIYVPVLEALFFFPV